MAAVVAEPAEPAVVHACTARLLTFGDNNYKMWWDMGWDVVLVLVVMSSLSGVVDWWLGGLHVSRGALRVRCVTDLLISTLFLFKLYGLYLLSVPVHALLSWAVVRAVVRAVVLGSCRTWPGRAGPSAAAQGAARVRSRRGVGGQLCACSQRTPKTWAA